MTLTMPSHLQSWREAIAAYLDWLKRRGIQPITIRDYEYSLWRSYRVLESAGALRGPLALREENIQALRAGIRGAPNFVKAEITYLGSFLRYTGNPVIDRMALRWPPEERPSVRWHTQEEQMRLRAEAQDREILLLHLHLDLCLRRVESMRLSWEDFDGTQIRIVGKGLKLRWLPYHPLTPDALSAFPGGTSGPLFADREHIKNRGHRLTRSAMDAILKGLGKRAGVKTSFHTLRRTGARNLWEAGAKVETIATVLGHADTRTTLKYIGVSLDHVSEAWQLVVQKTRIRLKENETVDED